MKIPRLLLTLGMLASSLMPSIAAPLLRYEFNEAGAVQNSSGSHSLDLTQLNYSGAATDYTSAAPVQREGTPNSLALNFTAANVDAALGASDKAKGAVQTSISSATAGFLREGLDSFTISAWVLNVTGSADRRIFNLRDTSSNKSIIDFRLSANNTLMLGLSGSDAAGTFYNLGVTVPLNSAVWHFVAISYDAETGEMTFYSGAEGGNIVSGMAANSTTGNLLQSANSLIIGNAGYEHQRRLDGYLSDVRYYGSALSAQEVSAIHAIPEPGVSMLLGAGVLLAGVHYFKPLKR